MSDSPRRANLLSLVWTLLRWPVALGVLGWLVYQNVYLNSEELLSRTIQWWAVGIAVVTFASALLLTYFRWYLLVRAQEFVFTYSDAVRLGLVGMLFNFVAPGSVGGDVVKGAMIAKQQQARRLAAAATVFLDRCVGTLALFIVGAIAFLFLPPHYRAELAWMASLFLVGTVLGLIGLVAALWPRVTEARWLRAMTEWRYVGRFLLGSLTAVRLYQAKWRVIVGCVLVSMVSHVGMLSTFFYCSQALTHGSAVPEYNAQLVFGAGSNFIQAFVPTPGGAGAFESAFAAGFHAVDGAKVDHLHATHDPGETPPDWRPALLAMTEPKNARKLGEVAVHTPGLETAAISATIGGMLDGEISAGQAFTTGTDRVPANAVWAAYRAGHTGMAFREGLLAALGFRVLTVFVAIIGAVLYFASRREIDNAIEEEEREAHEENATPIVRDIEPVARTA